MKLVQLDRDALLRPLQAVTGIVEKRHTLPILSNVLIERKQGRVNLLATDLEIQVATSANIAAVAGEEISLTVSARKLQDILRALPDGSETALDAQNNRLQVRAGKSRRMRNAGREESRKKYHPAFLILPFPPPLLDRRTRNLREADTPKLWLRLVVAP